MKPENPTILVNYYDIAILTAIGIFNIVIWRYGKGTIINWKTMTAWFLLFFIVLPMISIKIELTCIYYERNPDYIDGFELLYLWFRFPTWWFWGLVEFVILKVVNKKTAYNNGLLGSRATEVNKSLLL